MIAKPSHITAVNPANCGFEINIIEIINPIIAKNKENPQSTLPPKS